MRMAFLKKNFESNLIRIFIDKLFSNLLLLKVPLGELIKTGKVVHRFVDAQLRTERLTLRHVANLSIKMTWFATSKDRYHS